MTQLVQVSVNGLMGPPGASAVPVATSTSNRPNPASLQVGAQIFDTTLNKPLWVNAARNGWVDAMGTAVEEIVNT